MIETWTAGDVTLFVVILAFGAYIVLPVLHGMMTTFQAAVYAIQDRWLDRTRSKNVDVVETETKRE